MGVAARTTTEMGLPNEQKSSFLAIWDQIGGVVSGLAIVLSILAIISTVVLAIRWYSTPFLGVLTTSAAVVNGTRTLGNSPWMGFQAGLMPGDKILKIDDTSLEGLANPGEKINQVLATRHVGDEVSLEIYRPGAMRLPKAGCYLYTSEGATCTFSFALLWMPFSDFAGHFGIPLVVEAFLLILGAVIWRLRRQQATARLIAMMCGALAIIISGRFELITTYQTPMLWVLATCVLSGGLLDLALLFPYELALIRQRPWIRVLPFAVTVVAFLGGLAVYRQAQSIAFDAPQLVGAVFLVLAGVVVIVSLVYRRGRAVTLYVRDQCGIALIGAVITLAPMALWLITVLIERIAHQLWNLDLSSITFSSVFILPAVIAFPLSLAYVLLQRRLADSDRIVSESVIYGALGLFLVIGYTLVTGAIYLLTWGAVRPDNPVVIGILLFLIALAFAPLRLRLERAVDRAFFKQTREYERRLEQFARDLTTSVDMNDTVRKLRTQLDETVAPPYIFIFLRNLATGEYEPYMDPDTGKPQTDLHFSPDSALIAMLRGESSIVYMEPGRPLPVQLYNERSRLAVLNAPVIARLQSVDRMNGFIALGVRQDHSAYHFEEFRFIQGLADQAAAAFERSQMIVEAQRTARELRVLAQVSAALNIPMDFDTLLEFVYTQTDKVISAPNFYIALRDERNDELYYAFYQEAGDRLADKEGLRWRMGRDLISEVVRTGQPIKTEQYVYEMNRRDQGLRIDNTELRAWMGVPLNAGTGQALGCLAIGTVDSTLIYSEEQLRIFWAIADLAATAIYKARLFAETEERARQMKVLNDISSKLASEFENLDALLSTITESAVEMLRAEAGSLLLQDEATSELIFQLAIGGSGQDLVGSRIPAGSGIAGTVVSTGRHVIVNDTQHDTRWFGEVTSAMDSPRTFATRAILAVPLTARGGVIGVLEVINKKDGTPFVEDEVNLLNTFAGQAAIAIENARLFQMTDQALAERVQQLDNMQRIDQELNRTLDLQRVVDLTIDNAMRESNADSGTLAIVNPDPLSFEIAGSIGYPDDRMSPGEILPITYGILGQVYRSGQAALITALEMTNTQEIAKMLPGVQCQLAVPLVTGDRVSAILLLESLDVDTFNMMTTAFIKGLAEHANTAITNAQLFARLQEANQARGKFVSFVAHELKNPMTSIKGYAEVLLGGVTGALTEQQQNFIAVIQRNAVRVQQLVTDLNDITAQETGNLTLKFGAISFNNVILETLRPQQRAIDDKDQTVDLNAPDNLPLVWGDELRLIQVMTNFVSNANKYTPPGGTITILAEHVSNRWDPNGAAEVVHCCVSDTGIGMSEDDLKMLFKPYWRSENPRAREQPGTGLGMTLTRGLIEAHNGKIWVESTLNVGTSFHFTVPLAAEMEKIASR